MKPSFDQGAPRSAFSQLSLLADTSLEGMRVIAARHWPREPDGVVLRRVPAHRLICWLARWLPVRPYTDIKVQRWRDAEPLVDWHRRVIFCSERQAEALRDAAHLS